MNPIAERSSATIRFCGDTGAGMHQIGAQFASVCETSGYRTFSRAIPAGEIRAPVGTLAGVSGYEVHFSSRSVAPGATRLQTLVALDPAALRIHGPDLEDGGILIVDREGFTADALAKARYLRDPLADGSLQSYRLLAIPATTLTRESVVGGKIAPREAERCLHFSILGFVCWLYERSTDSIQHWIRDRFARNPLHAEACLRVLRAGFQYGESTPSMLPRCRVTLAERSPGVWRRISGADAIVLAFAAAAERSGRTVVYAACPAVPTAIVLEKLTDLKRYGITAMQAEDEPAAVGIAIGASFGGSIGATAASGPGIVLQAEGVGLAVMAELPLVLIHVQRAGPAMGIATLSEQADLLQAMYGRNGESPVAVLAPMSPSDHFSTVLEAVRIADRYRTPVVVLTDSDLLSRSEPWKIPDASDLPDLRVSNPEAEIDPWRRDGDLARVRTVPGTGFGEHCTSGSERDETTGEVSHDPVNHGRMVELRAAKVAGIARTIPAQEVEGRPEGDLLVVGWGSTRGAISAAVGAANARGERVGHIHLRYIEPFPSNLAEIFRSFGKYLVVERNRGQLALLLRSQFLIDAASLSDPDAIEPAMAKLLGRSGQE